MRACIQTGRSEHPYIRLELSAGGVTGGMIAGDTMSGRVKLPEALRQAPGRFLCDVAIGETVHVSFVKMRVNAKGYCSLNPAAKIVKNHLNPVRVERREDG